MRRRSVLLVIGAILLTVGGGAVAGLLVTPNADLVAETTTPLPVTSTALAVSRRSDPSLDRYTRTSRRTTFKSSLNGAQLWLAEHARPLVAHDSDPTVSLNAVGWGAKSPVDVYVNATGINLYNAPQLRDARAWLVKKNGKQVLVDGWAMLDIRNPAARKFWLLGADGKATCNPERLRRAALDLIACGYRGLWLDNILTQPAQWFKPDPGIDAAQWGEGLVALLTELRAALPAGTPFTINEHWTDSAFGYTDDPKLDPASAFVRTAQLADQLVIEGGAIDPGLNYGGAVTDQWSYRRLLAYADALHALGVRVQWEKTGSTDLTRNAAAKLGTLPSCRDGDLRRAQPAWGKGDAVWRAHVRTAAFNTATALLTVAAGDSVGDMCEYPGRGWRGYGVDLGAPVAPRLETGGVILRAFEGGIVAVNPSDAPVVVTLPDNRYAINLASTAPPAKPRVASNRFNLPGRTAIVGTYSTPAPATSP